MKYLIPLALFLAAWMGSPDVWAENTTCQDRADESGGSPCGAGSGLFTFPVDGSAGFDLRGTQYATTGAKLSTPCPGGTDRPDVRYWSLGNWDNANMGLQDQDSVGLEYIWNACDDAVISGVDGIWMLVNPDWSNPGAEGCGSGESTVVDMSWCDSANGDAAMFAVAVSPDLGGFWEFPGLATASLVPEIERVGVGEIDVSTMDVTVTLPSAFPTAALDLGAGITLADVVVGYQILSYGPSASPPPTGCQVVADWTPVDNPAGGVLPVQDIAGGDVTVRVPFGSPTDLTYVGIRVVYADATSDAGAGDCSTAATCFAPELATCFSAFLRIPAAYPVVMERFEAVRQSDDSVLIAWDVTMEVDVLRYRLDREEVGGTTVTVGTRYAHGPYAPYELTDTGASPNQGYTYRLYEVNDSSVANLVASVRLEPADSGAAAGGARQRNTRR